MENSDTKFQCGRCGREILPDFHSCNNLANIPTYTLEWDDEIECDRAGEDHIYGGTVVVKLSDLRYE